MKYIDVCDERIPALGLGTWPLKGEKCKNSVINALEVGYRHIDTAQSYENEDMVGKALKETDVDRDEIFLTTKVWRTNLRYEDVKEKVKESLEKLRTNYIDLLLIHWPNPNIPIEETLKAMNELIKKNKVNNIGVSNFPVQLLKEAQEKSENHLICDQVEYHPFLSQKKLLEHCKSSEVMLTAYAPLSKGKVINNNVLREIGEKYSKTPAQITLRWHMQQENVAAIPRTTTKKHREENYNIFDFELNNEEMNKISNLANGTRNTKPEFSPNWD